MSKFRILLAVAALVASATQAWDGKLFEIRQKDKYDGVMVRYYTEQELLPEKLNLLLRSEGFKFIADLYPRWEKYVEGIRYQIFPDTLCEKNELNEFWHYAFSITEELLYQSVECWAKSKPYELEKRRIIFLVCKEDNQKFKQWFAQYRHVFNKLLQHYPLTFKETDFIDGKPESALYQSPWSRFVNFLNEEKIALGLTTVGALLLAISSTFSS